MSDTPKKRVLFISPQPFFEWRGSPIRVSFDTLALAQQGCEVDLLTMPMGADHPLPGVRHLRIRNPFRLKKLPIGPSLWKAVYDVFLFFHAAVLAFAHRYDVIHGVEDAGVIAVILGRLTGARVVFEKHSDPRSYRHGVFRNLVLFLYAQVERLSIRLADAVITTGFGLAGQVRRVSPRAKVFDISDVPSSLAEADPAEVCRLRERLCRTPDERLVLYVGSFAVYQGVDLMFASLPLIARRFSPVRFLIVGGSEAAIAERKRQLAEEGLDQAVEFLGHVSPDRLPNYLAAADVLLSPRLAGVNTPLKLLDYLKAGRAIVATDTEANRQILSEKVAILTPAEPAAFADGVVRALEDDALRARFGKNGRRLLDERYTYEEFSRRLAAAYAELGPRKPGLAGASLVILLGDMLEELGPCMEELLEL